MITNFLDVTMLATFVFGSTQVLKMAGLPSKWLPVMAILLGGLINGVQYLDYSLAFIAREVVFGMFTGLTTTGIIDFVKHE